MRRKLFTLAAGASAVLCAGVCVLWVRSYKNPDRFSGLRGGDRYTLVSAAGRVTLFGPPPEPPALRADQTAAVLDRVGNGDIHWIVSASDPDLRVRLSVVVYGRGPAAVLDPPWDDRHGRFCPALIGIERAPALLRALEEPDRFVAGQYGLMGPDARLSPYLRAQRLPDGSVRCWLGALRVDLRPYDERTDSSDMHFFDGAATIDVAQFPAIRD